MKINAAHRGLFLWLALSSVLFGIVVALIGLGHRGLSSWLVLLSTFVNLVGFALLWKNRQRAG